VLKFSRPDTPAPWSGRTKPVMEITCSGRASTRTIEPSRPDDVLIQERFLRKNLRKSCRTVVRPDGHGPLSSYYCYSAKIFANLRRFFFGLFFLEYSCWFSFCRIMSAISSQRQVRQRTEAEQNEIQAKIMDRTVIAEWNVVRVDIMVAPLNSIHETIQHYQWTYFYTCACIVLTRLV
jgi:hypothetical protein